MEKGCKNHKETLYLVALVSTSFKMFIVVGMYNFEEVVNIKRERSKKITQPHNGVKTSIKIYV